MMDQRTRVSCLVVGDIFIDINMKVDSLQIALGGITQCSQLKYAFGGSGNVSSALSLLAIDNCFMGKAGKDALGEQYRVDLEKCGTKTNILVDSELPTGILVSIIDNSAERSFLISRGANDGLSPDEIESALSTVDYDVLYITGYSLVNSPQRDAILRVANHAHRMGAKIFFDAGAYNTIKDSQKYFDEILKLSAIVSTNEKEALALTQLTDSDKALRELSDLAPIIVMRLGMDGCVISAHGKEIRVPAPTIAAIDTTGAGDAFNAAFIYGMLNNWSYEHIGLFANWFASKKIEQIGARSFPLKSEIHATMSRLRQDN